MPEFTIIDEKRFPLDIKRFKSVRGELVEADQLPYFRFEHRVTIGYRGRRLMAFIDQLKGKVFIEEITDGNLTMIEDALFVAAFMFIEPQGFLGVFAPIFKPVKA